MKTSRNIEVTMAIVPTPRGFGYIVFESPDEAMDWGVKEIGGKSKLRDALLKAKVLLHMVQPEVLVLEDAEDESSRRLEGAREFLDKLAKLAEEGGIKVQRYSRAQVLARFAKAGARNKDDIAAVVVKHVPELQPRLPPRRRIWESEHYAMGIFESAALALTHFARVQGRKKNFE